MPCLQTCGDWPLCVLACVGQFVRHSPHLPACAPERSRYVVSATHASPACACRYFKARTTKLPLIFNFNLVLASCHHDLWERQKTDARVVHYTIYKARRQLCSN